MSAQASGSRLITETFRGIAYPKPPKDLHEELQRIIDQAKVGSTPNQLRFWVEDIHVREQFRWKGPIWGPGDVVFRARSVDKPPDHVREISYRREGAQINRFNRSGMPMFYGAAGRRSFGVCLHECHAKTDEHFVVGMWYLKRPLLFGQLGFSRRLKESRPFRQYPQQFLGNEETPSCQILKEWQCDVVTKPIEGQGDGWIYPVSTALAEMAFDSKFFPDLEKRFNQSRVAGLIYPSVATNTFGDNVAIRPEVIDNDFEFVTAVYMKIGELCNGSAIRSHNQDAGQIKALQEAFADRDGNLEWFPVKPPGPIFRPRPPYWLIGS